MKYQTFIEAITKHQTKRVRAINLPQSSSPDPIPANFITLIPDVIHIMDKHFDELSDGMPYLGIFGLQPVGFAVQSSMPIAKGRIASSTQMSNHLCCILYFLPMNTINQVTDWKNHKSIIIDFTKGAVIDQARYLHYVVHSKELGKTYGKINAKKLADVWQAVALATGF